MRYFVKYCIDVNVKVNNAPSPIGSISELHRYKADTARHCQYCRHEAEAQGRGPTPSAAHSLCLDCRLVEASKVYYYRDVIVRNKKCILAQSQKWVCICSVFLDLYWKL